MSAPGLAGTVGFQSTRPWEGLAVLKTAAFNRSATSPEKGADSGPLLYLFGDRQRPLLFILALASARPNRRGLETNKTITHSFPPNGKAEYDSGGPLVNPGSRSPVIFFKSCACHSSLRMR